MAPRRADATPTPTEQVRRGQLIEATIDLICERGCAVASLSAIAQQAGMSKAAVLYHFSSKDNLTQATLTHVLDSVTAYVTERVAHAAGEELDSWGAGQEVGVSLSGRKTVHPVTG
ncbi:TetR family transcriptional regulator [Streptomyces sp. NBC_01378]|uniref:TetR/AcrR family transcriptional regulator n=1 Tax=Streptomyces sp. NBC_01378 TaxID=2903844 RepID=UPI003247CF16